MSNAQRNHYWTLVAITDDNGQSHDAHCSSQADGTLVEKIDYEGLDWDRPYGIARDDLLATWLADGTVTCRCAASA